MIDRFLTWLFGRRTVDVPGTSYRLRVPRWWGDERVLGLIIAVREQLDRHRQYIMVPWGVSLCPNKEG